MSTEQFQPPQNPLGQQPQYQQQPTSYPQQPYYPPPPVIPPPQPKKKSRTWLWIVLGVIGLVLFACIAVSLLAGKIAQAPTATPGSVATTTSSNASSTTQSASSSSANQVSKVGGTITLNGVQATLISAKVYNGGAYNSPNPGNEYVLVKVHLKNTSSNDETYNVEDFHLKSGTGNITDPDALSFDTSLNGLNNGTLAANGGTADGDIVFQMKKDDHKAELTWQPSFFQNAGDNGWYLGL